MTKFQTIAIVLSISLAPLSGYAGDQFAKWVISHMNHKPSCNEQALAWINSYPSNQPLASMPAFHCVVR